MDADVTALLRGDPLPAETPGYKRAWREAKIDSGRSEYAFKLNYNYYDSPDSMYKYNPALDAK